MRERGTEQTTETNLKSTEKDLKISKSDLKLASSVHLCRPELASGFPVKIIKMSLKVQSCI